ncbi:MAG TPA: hypothetical protein VF607_09735 [Verrucomicrobiae bacterium]
MLKFKKMVFAVDFDGTVVFHKFPHVGAPTPGAIDTLRYILSHGGRIVLNTMRSDRPERAYLTEAVEWFALHHIDLYGINKNPGQASWTTSPKVYAHYYIDDAALGAPLKYDPELCERMFIDWRSVRQILDAIVPEAEPIHVPAGTMGTE